MADGSKRLQIRPRFRSLNELELSPTDLDIFSAALLDSFPTIRFLLSDYREPWVERQFGYRELEGRRYRETISETMRPPHGDPMPYAQSLRHLPQDRILVWLEPPGWRPQWSAKPYRQNKYVLLNEPSLHFIFVRSAYIIQGPEGTRGDQLEPPALLGEDEVCCLWGGHMYGRYYADDLEQQDFLRSVWRIVRRITTQELVLIDLSTLDFRLVPKALPLRVGLDAARWTQQDRRHLIGSEIVYRAADGFRAGSRKAAR
jgi:hypothetical protein